MYMKNLTKGEVVALIVAIAKKISEQQATGISSITWNGQTNSLVFTMSDGSQITTPITLDASDISYSNAISGLVAENVQNAIDELETTLNSDISELGNSLNETDSRITNILNNTLKITNIVESFSIPITNWTTLENADPYTYSTTVNITSALSTNSIVELINNQPVLFATYGFAIGNISGQVATIYSIGQPSESVTLTLGVTG